MKTKIFRELVVEIMIMVLFSRLVFAQTELSPGKDDIPGAQKIYSPYVERTANDRNFAEGPTGATHIYTHAIPLIRE